MRGTYELAVQQSNWAYFGVVTLDVSIERGLLGLQVDYVDAKPEWRAGVYFGIYLAYEKSLAAGACVRVLEVRGHAVDTTVSVMAFVAAQAFFRALDIPAPPELALHPAEGRFSFPKWDTSLQCDLHSCARSLQQAILRRCRQETTGR